MLMLQLLLLVLLLLLFVFDNVHIKKHPDNYTVDTVEAASEAGAAAAAISVPNKTGTSY